MELFRTYFAFLFNFHDCFISFLCFISMTADCAVTGFESTSSWRCPSSRSRSYSSSVWAAPLPTTPHQRSGFDYVSARFCIANHAITSEHTDSYYWTLLFRQSNLQSSRQSEPTWYGHVSRSSGPAKIILQGTVKGGRRRKAQKQRREVNIREWTDLEFAKSQRAVGNRKKWRKLVIKFSVVPQRPQRLRDR